VNSFKIYQSKLFITTDPKNILFLLHLVDSYPVLAFRELIANC